MPPRHLVVGDVHGCLAELDQLLELAFREGDRQVVLAGDLVAKGPDSSGVLRRARELGALAVRGNHDQKLIRWRQAVQAGEAEPPSLGEEHAEAAVQLDEGDWAYLKSLPYYLRLEEHRAIVVHAGLVPGVPLEEQREQDMLNMRSIRADGSASKRIEGVPWASRWPGPELVLFGHDAVRGLQMYAHAVGLDTGCVYGGRLSGYLLPEGRLVQVDAR